MRAKVIEEFFPRMEVDFKHFNWRTHHRYISIMEQKLLSLIPKGNLICEVGCGEGPNLYHLVRESTNHLIIGLDIAFEKVKYASQHIANALFICGDAFALPFKSDIFEVVWSRDLLHHLDDKEKAVNEMVRVLKPGGKFLIIEPNRCNPLFFGQGLLFRRERGTLKSTADLLEKIVRKQSQLVWDGRQGAEGFPFARVFFLIRWGLPNLAASRLVGAIFRGLDEFFDMVIPNKMMAYIIISARKKG